jgi:hypothetical protein
MRIKLVLQLFGGFLLVCAAPVYGQLTCVPVPNTTMQNCAVTITVTGGVAPYTFQSDPVKRSTSPVVQHTFNDPGSIKHCYDALTTFANGTTGTSNTECWTTPPIKTTPPPVSYPTVPPDPSIIIVTATDTWTLGAESTTYKGFYLILKNSKSVGGAVGSKLALCQGSIYAIGRNTNWWQYLKNTWRDTNLKTLPCDA